MHLRCAQFASIPVLFILIGCDPPASAPAGSSSAAPSTTASSVPSAAATPTSATTAPAGATTQASAVPENLDVAELQKALKCGGADKTGPCSVLAAFAAPCAPWSAAVPSGDGRWMGRGYLVQGGKASDQVTLLRARRVPLTEVGPGQLPVKIAVAEIPKDDPSVEQAQKAIRAFERADVPAKNNAGVEYVKGRTDWVEAFATKTTGGQVYALAQGGTFVCQGPKQQLLLVQRAGSRTDKADGIYAELWAATW
jgi:hypothetical protein